MNGDDNWFQGEIINVCCRPSDALIRRPNDYIFLDIDAG